MVTPLAFTYECVDTDYTGVDQSTMTASQIACNQSNKTSFFTTIGSQGTNNFSMDVWLYSEIDAFTTFYNDVKASEKANDGLVTDADINHADDYSPYIMQWDCNYTVPVSQTTDKTSVGCCLQDMEDTEGGGYCLLYSSANDSVTTTYRLTQANFETVTASATPNFDADWEQTDEDFNKFNCYNISGATDTQDDNGMTQCRKWQFWPAASWANGFRFEKDHAVRAYLYDGSADATTAAIKWVDEDGTLNSAMSFTMLASTLAAVAFTFTF